MNLRISTTLCYALPLMVFAMSASAGEVIIPLPPGAHKPVANSGGKQKTIALIHDPQYDAANCISLLDKPSLYGGFVNSCNYTVMYTYCAYHPEKDSWVEFFDCEKQKFGTDFIGPNKTQTAHTNRAESIKVAACMYRDANGEYVDSGPYGGTFDAQKKELFYSCNVKDSKKRESRKKEEQEERAQLAREEQAEQDRRDRKAKEREAKREAKEREAKEREAKEQSRLAAERAGQERNEAARNSGSGGCSPDEELLQRFVDAQSIWVRQTSFKPITLSAARQYFQEVRDRFFKNRTTEELQRELARREKDSSTYKRTGSLADKIRAEEAVTQQMLACEISQSQAAAASANLKSNSTRANAGGQQGAKFSGSCKAAYDRQEAEFTAINQRKPNSQAVLPGLQVLLYMTSQRLDMLDQLCKGQPQYGEYASMKETYDSTMRTCRQIATNNTDCVARVAW